MQLLNRVAGIEYGVLESVELDAMSCLLAEQFSRHEPLAVAVGLPYAQIRAQVAAFGPKALAERLTIVARDSSTGELLGALLTEDFATPLPTDVAMAAPDFAPLGSLLEGLDNRYRAAHPVEPGTHLHLFMLGVATQVACRGVGSTLVATCLANGRQRGYTTAVTEATGAISQHVFRKLGFRELFLASYKTFQFHGERVLASIAEPEGTILMARSI